MFISRVDVFDGPFLFCFVFSSVMNAAFSRDTALSEEENRACTLGAPKGEEIEAEERVALERVEALVDRFCEQVRGSSIFCRVHTRNWQMERETASFLSGEW